MVIWIISVGPYELVLRRKVKPQRVPVLLDDEDTTPTVEIESIIKPR